METATEELIFLEYGLLKHILENFINSTTTDEVQDFIEHYFHVLLDRLISSNNGIRCKAIDILLQLSRLLQHKSNVKIDVKMIFLYIKESNSAFVLDFLGSFIRIGYPRLPIQDQYQLIPELLDCIESKEESNYDKLLIVIIPLIVQLREDPEYFKELFNFGERFFSKQLFLNILQDVLLLPYGITRHSDIPPGLSSYIFKCLTENSWSSERLENIKKSFVWLICNGKFNSVESFLPLVLATCDNRLSVSTPATKKLKDIYTSIDIIELGVSDPLYKFFSKNENLPFDRKRCPFSVKVRQKTIQFLIKCLAQRKLNDNGENKNLIFLIANSGDDVIQVNNFNWDDDSYDSDESDILLLSC